MSAPRTASFTVALSDRNRADFADLSGDFNPLHTDSAHAAKTVYGKCVLHGALSAGLVSRLAGMHLPGKDCLLHGMRLRFVAPILTPMTVRVEGRVVRDDGRFGEVEATVREEGSGRTLVEASYQFGRHETGAQSAQNSGGTAAKASQADSKSARILVTGASGGLGQALCSALGERAYGISRGEGAGWRAVPDLSRIDEQVFDFPIAGIIHCAWPHLSNDGLLDMPASAEQVEHHVAAPLKHALALARLLRAKGSPGATLMLVGSSLASPGRHAWRYPLYSLAKGMIPALVKMLALELAPSGHLSAGVTLDAIRGGMNKGAGAVALQAHADRSPWGELPEMKDVAAQMAWIIDNEGKLHSGSMFDFTGGSLP